MSSAVAPSSSHKGPSSLAFTTRPEAGHKQVLGSFLVRVIDSEKDKELGEVEEETVKENAKGANSSGASVSRGSSMSVAVSQRSGSPRDSTRRGQASIRQRRLAHPEYDARLDNHKQTYVLSPSTLEALRKSVRVSQHRMFSDPNKSIAFHPPRRPLLLSYPTKPSKSGKALYVTRPPPSPRAAETAEKLPEIVVPENIPDTEDAHEFLRLAYHLRTGATRTYSPAPKKLRRPHTVAPTQTKAQLLAKEKGFILDGIALSNIQDDYAKVQPKLGPAIPPYNSHFDRHVGSYFRYQGVQKTLRKTMQERARSCSIQGRAVDRFHNIGDGHIYIDQRNKAGAGYSRDSVDGHDQFLADARPVDGYNGRFGFRRNTPLLRNCPSPFGTASRSPTH